ncbi:MAG: PQQ-dependent sugar dehydrogenase [Anaerolineae bacterium]|nr:PQQ-dependent sugar dehydrogenase [Anaerolineae bacterium]
MKLLSTRTFVLGTVFAVIMLFLAGGPGMAGVARGAGDALQTPTIQVSPPSLDVTQAPDTVSVHSLTIENLGSADLEWVIAEQSTSPSALDITLVEVATGLDEPVNMANAGDSRLFIVEKDGTIAILDAGAVLPTPFLDINARVGSSGSEQGLLGLAFHPDYASNGYFFVNYTDNSGDTVISRFSVTANPNVADPNSEVVLLTVDQTATNHNGGDLAFGLDGYLYIPLGDGGGSGDTLNNAQNETLLLGKIARIDVDSSGGSAPDCVGSGSGNYTVPASNPFVDGAGNTCDEIWNIGVRNPWRFTFDSVTGDMIIADVGQSAWEEINVQLASSLGGENYGWRCYEGNHAYNTSGCGPIGDYEFPVFEYSHALGCSVTGGHLYRGTLEPPMIGHYLFTDYCTGNFWSMTANSLGGWTTTQLPGSYGFGLVTFGQGADGELYVANISNGKIFHIVENTAADQIAWVSVSAETGTTPAAGTSVVDVTFDSTGLVEGTYTGILRVHSNDPATPLVEVPLTLTVGAEDIRMASSGILMRGRVVGGGSTIARALVIVRDETGARVSGADVHVTWTKPDGSTENQIAATSATGRAVFQTSNAAQGTYTIEVTDIVKDGYWFDSTIGTTMQSLDVP